MDIATNNNQIIKLESIDSTNNYANKLIKEQRVKSGTVIWANEQYKGRGIRNNQWDSETGKSLTFSIILYPDFINIDDHFLISKFVSLALTDFLEKENVEATIKWPNDIYVGDKKIAGILIENTIMKSKIATSVIGIGININQQKFNENLPNPVSLTQITGKAYDIEEILHKILYHINYWYNEIKSATWDDIFTWYLEKLYNLNYKSKFKVGDKYMYGKVIGVTKIGHLILEIDDGKIMTFSYKEIEYA